MRHALSVLLVAQLACGSYRFADIAPMDLATASGFLIGGASPAVLATYGEPLARDTVDYGMGVVQMVWRYPTHEFTFWLNGLPFCWTITAAGPTTYRGLAVGESRARARELYGPASTSEVAGDTTWFEWIMPPRAYPRYGIRAVVVRDTVRQITVGELLLVVM